jgi:hypothetical protein
MGKQKQEQEQGQEQDQEQRNEEWNKMMINKAFILNLHFQILQIIEKFWWVSFQVSHSKSQAFDHSRTTDC